MGKLKLAVVFTNGREIMI